MRSQEKYAGDMNVPLWVSNIECRDGAMARRQELVEEVWDIAHAFVGQCVIS